MGGTDDPANLVVLTIEDHAIAHFVLWKMYGKIQDKVAWMGLSNVPLQVFMAERMRVDNPNKGWNNHTARAVTVDYIDGSSKSYDYGKQFSEDTGIPYVTCKYLWKTGKGSRKHNIRRVIQHGST